MVQIKNTVRDALHGHPNVSLICEVVELLVYNQFVVGRHYVTGGDYGAFRVRKGSGMGLLHSGDLADLLFDHLVDRWMLRDSTRRGLGIKAYVRFKDDCLALVAGDKVDTLFELVRKRAKFFVVKLEEVAMYRVAYLNLTIIKAGTRLFFSHYTKPTAMSIPLSSLSGQPCGVHVSWPQGVIKSIYSLSTRVVDARKAASRMQQRFGNSTVPYIYPGDSPIQRRSQPRRDRADTLWMALKYHPSVAGPLQRITGQCMRESAAAFSRGVSTFLGMKTVSVAWANNGRPLFVKLRNL